MYDIHSHVLFGVDDGAKDIEESLEICRALSLQGVKAVAATPHYKDGELEIEQSKILSEIFLLSQEVKSEEIDIAIMPGMEIYASPNIPDLYEKNRIMTLNGKNYMLIELPFYDIMPRYMDEMLFSLQLKGIKPVIAHPERCSSVIKHPNLVYDLIDNGCIIQLDSGSILGLYGRNVKKTAGVLLEHSMVHVVASDSHSVRNNDFSHKKCFEAIGRKFGKNTAENLFINNPYSIINGEDLYIEEPVKIKQKKFWRIG